MDCEESVILKIRERRERGLQKYGVGMERTDLSRLDWLRHAQAEAFDLAIYLERLILDEEKMASVISAVKAECQRSRKIIENSRRSGHG